MLKDFTAPRHLHLYSRGRPYRLLMVHWMLMNSFNQLLPNNTRITIQRRLQFLTKILLGWRSRGDFKAFANPRITRIAATVVTTRLPISTGIT